VPQSKGRIGGFGQFVADGRHNSGGKSLIGSADHFEHERPRKSMRRFQQLDGRQFSHC
jgi:hypothetical protein